MMPKHGDICSAVWEPRDSCALQLWLLACYIQRLNKEACLDYTSLYDLKLRPNWLTVQKKEKQSIEIRTAISSFTSKSTF